MEKWISGIAATIIGGVIVYWLTVGVHNPSTQSPSSTKPKVIRGYLVVDKSSKIQRVEDLRKGDQICTTKKQAEILRSLTTLSEIDYRTLPISENYQAYRVGICKAIFMIRKEDADKFFPVGPTYMRLIPVYDK